MFDIIAYHMIERIDWLSNSCRPIFFLMINQLIVCSMLQVSHKTVNRRKTVMHLVLLAGALLKKKKKKKKQAAKENEKKKNVP